MSDTSAGSQAPADLLVSGGDVVTMAPNREVVSGASIAVRDGVITEIGEPGRLRVENPGAEVIDARGCIVIPGMIDAHQHLTGDPLIRSAIPDLLAPGLSIFEWSVPAHGAHTPADDEVAATLTALSCLKAGVTTVIEAGTVAHPRSAVAGLDATGIRATIGRWGWDEPGVPFTAPVDEVLDAQRELVGNWPAGGRVEGWVTLVGHSLASDELLGGAAELARELGVGMTMHMSPTSSDPEYYGEKFGHRPLEHLDSLGVLFPGLVLAHAVWIDDLEVSLVLDHDVAIAFCPWAHLRLGQGATVAGRHAEIMEAGGRIALGCDSCNAADHHDILSTAALAAGLARDTRIDPTRFGAHRALELATIDGARAVGKADLVGSIEVGKAADLVVIDATGIEWAPRGEVALQLVWGGAGRDVRDVVVDGRVVVREGRSTLLDEDALIEAAHDRQRALLEATGITIPSPWPHTEPT
ncbi:MAG: amidohydrolase family protein [Acidimicrobiales bacterium]